jgi:hypothetical protein
VALLALPAGAGLAQPELAGPSADKPALEAPLPDPGEHGWAATMDLYGFMPLRTTGTITIRGLEAESDTSLREVLDVLQFAASGRGSLEYGRIGVMADLSYVDLADRSATLVGEQKQYRASSQVRTTQGTYDLALRYRFGERESAMGRPGRYSIIPYAGVRLIDPQLTLTAQLEDTRGNTLIEASRSYGNLWVQPLLGTQATVFLSPRLRAFARADLGGFGLSHEKDLSGNAQVGLGYAIGNSTVMNVSWRYSFLEGNDGAERDSGVTSYQNGVEMGLKFFFGGAPTRQAALPAAEPAPTPEPTPEPLPTPPAQPDEPVRGLW